MCVYMCIHVYIYRNGAPKKQNCKSADTRPKPCRFRSQFAIYVRENTNEKLEV